MPCLTLVLHWVGQQDGFIHAVCRSHFLDLFDVRFCHAHTNICPDMKSFASATLVSAGLDGCLHDASAWHRRPDLLSDL